MKKLLLMAAVAFAFAACGNSNSNKEAECCETKAATEHVCNHGEGHKCTKAEGEHKCNHENGEHKCNKENGEHKSNHAADSTKHECNHKKQKEKADKMLLKLEFAVGISCIVVLLACSLIASFVKMQEWIKVVIVFVGLIPLLVALPFLIKIEQTAGYYECKHCQNKYIPSYKSVFMAMHYGRTRYMKCPKCNKYSWQKKLINKD